MSGILLSVLAVLVALPGAAAALHLTVLAVASLAYRERRPPAPERRLRFLVLIPAHDEEAVIGGALEAVMRERRDGDRVLVVADRCGDATAAVARAHGAEVLERGPSEPPGRAAARQAGLDAALAAGGWDAVVMIDADSVVEPGFLDACERRLAAGALALQARSEAALGQRLVEQASLAAFALQGITIPRGRDRLGLSVRLRGTGMVLAREVAARHRFRAPASEDLWYSLDLCLAGVLPRHVDSARLRSASVRSWKAAATQRRRYEAGRMAAARAYLPPLLRRHTLASLEAAWHLATPPFALAVVSLLAGAALAALAGATWLAAVLGGLLVLYGLDLCLGLAQARAGARTWLALLAAPWYLAWKLVVQARAVASLRRAAGVDVPTRRG